MTHGGVMGGEDQAYEAGYGDGKNSAHDDWMTALSEFADIEVETPMEAVAFINRLQAVVNTAQRLLDDIWAIYPGQELWCPQLRVIEAALNEANRNDGDHIRHRTDYCSVTGGG